MRGRSSQRKHETVERREKMTRAAEGKLYFAAKIGMYLFALIYPSIELLKNEKFITKLEELCAKSKVAYDNAQ